MVLLGNFFMGENIQKCDMSKKSLKNNTESHLCMIYLQACLISEEVVFSCCGFLGKFMDCFTIIHMEKQAINFPKIVHNARSCCQV